MPSPPRTGVSYMLPHLSGHLSGIISSPKDRTRMKRISGFLHVSRSSSAMEGRWELNQCRLSDSTPNGAVSHPGLVKLSGHWQILAVGTNTLFKPGEECHRERSFPWIACRGLEKMEKGMTPGHRTDLILSSAVPRVSRDAE